MGRESAIRKRTQALDDDFGVSMPFWRRFGEFETHLRKTSSNIMSQSSA